MVITTFFSIQYQDQEKIKQMCIMIGDDVRSDTCYAPYPSSTYDAVVNFVVSVYGYNRRIELIRYRLLGEADDGSVKPIVIFDYLIHVMDKIRWSIQNNIGRIYASSLIIVCDPISVSDSDGNTPYGSFTINITLIRHFAGIILVLVS